MTTEEKEHDDTIVTQHDINVQVEIDSLLRLYAKVACNTWWPSKITVQECDMDKK